MLNPWLGFGVELVFSLRELVKSEKESGLPDPMRSEGSARTMTVSRFGSVSPYSSMMSSSSASGGDVVEVVVPKLKRMVKFPRL